MKKSKAVRVKFYVGMFIIMISYFIANQLLGNDSNGLFIIKKYGALEPYGSPKEKSPSRYQRLFLDDQGLVKESMMGYTLPKGDISSHTTISIFKYTNSEYAQNRLLLFVGNNKANLNYTTINEEPVLKIGKDGNPFWISGNIFIKTNFYQVDDPMPILDDYLSLYPPTKKIQESDFDFQKIFKVQIERSHEIIKDAEPMRILPARAVNRPEAYIGMVAQCMAESMIRCWSGMCEIKDKDKYTDCPITLMTEDISRNKAYKNFREKTMSLPIVEENVNWDSMPAGGVNCRFQHTEGESSFDDPRWLVLDNLKMSPKELAPLLLMADKLPDGIMPEMFE